MNQEIKFRAVIKWNPTEKTSEYAVIFFTLKKLLLPKIAMEFGMREILIPWLKKGNIPDMFAGLDKSGKEIYEGDIISGNATSHYNFTAEVYFNEKIGAFCFLTSLLRRNIDFEIIGNIYENPELLAQEK